MTARSKVEAEQRQQSPTFVNSSGRLYPVSHPKSSCLNKNSSSQGSKERFAREIQASSSCDLRVSPNHSLSTPHPIATPSSQSLIDEQKQSSATRNHSSKMDMAPDHFAYTDPQIESSTEATARLRCQQPSLGAGPSRDYFPTSNYSTSSKRADSKLSEDISSSPHGSEGVSPEPTKWHIDLEIASLHSDQSFDLGYKSRPAPPCLYKRHTRVWNSQYTRPLKDMLTEILEVRYPQREVGIVTERTALLGVENGSNRQKERFSWMSWFPYLATMIRG